MCTLSKAIAGVVTGFTEPRIIMLGDFNDGSFSPANIVADSSTLQFGELNHGPQAGGRRFLDVCIHRSGQGMFCAVNKLDDVSLDFGGAWGYVNGGTPVPNPATGAASCPAGYTATQVLGAGNVDWSVFLCSRPHQRAVDPLYDFGGMWGYVESALAPNPITGAASCPAGYTDQKVLDTSGLDWPLHVCFQAHVAGTTPAYGFGGMWGYVNSALVPNPATGAGSCPAGYTARQALGTAYVDWPLHFCWE